MGLPAPDYPLPVYRQPLQEAVRLEGALPITAAKHKPLEEAMDLQAASQETVAQNFTQATNDKPLALAFSVRRRRWSKKATIHWPALALSMPPLGYIVQDLKQDANTKVEDTKQDTQQGSEQHAKQEMEQDANTEVKFEEDTEVKFEQDSVQRSGFTDAEDSEFSVERSPMPRTPRTPRTSPGSATSDFSGFSMDSAYEDFRSRRDAFLAQCCCRLI